MSWIYRQSTGELLRAEGTLAGKGYAGAAPHGKNDPLLQDVHDVGPIPRGFYTIGQAYRDGKLGPVTMSLKQDACNRMLGRDLFFFHPDSITHPGEASEGCIVMPMAVLEEVAASKDRELEVTW